MPMLRRENPNDSLSSDEERSSCSCHACCSSCPPPRHWAQIVLGRFGRKCRIAWRRLFGTELHAMSDGTQLKTWVARDTKERFAAIARHQGLSDSALLKRLVELMLQTADAGVTVAVPTAGRPARDSRLTVRLHPADQSLLRERAAARGMPAATYVSVLTRAHLRALAPLPKEELLALKRTVAELGSVGRNLNQIAHAANRGERVTGPTREELRAILKVCEGLRDHVRNLLTANLKSWEQGYAERAG